MTYIYTEHDYLAHHGVKGMKWGIRRYQNEDGSLTTAGKRKYYNSDGSLTVAGAKRKRKQIISDAKQQYINEKARIKNKYSGLERISKTYAARNKYQNTKWMNSGNNAPILLRAKAHKKNLKNNSYVSIIGGGVAKVGIKVATRDFVGRAIGAATALGVYGLTKNKSTAVAVGIGARFAHSYLTGASVANDIIETGYRVADRRKTDKKLAKQNLK